MSDVKEELREAFEAAGYEVDEVTDNRGHVSVSIPADDADAGELRSVVREIVGEDSALGLDVTTESPEGRAGVSTVVSFRHRS